MPLYRVLVEGENARVRVRRRSLAWPPFLRWWREPRDEMMGCFTTRFVVGASPTDAAESPLGVVREELEPVL